MSRADAYARIPSEKEEELLQTLNSLPQFTLELGTRFEEIRLDYARLSLPYRSEFKQPAGFIHGGVQATLIDSVVVPAILSALDSMPSKLLTVDMHIHYLAAAKEQDLIAEGWVTKRGRGMVFLTAEVATTSGESLARGQVAYRVVM